jgi:hypothetical protein
VGYLLLNPLADRVGPCYIECTKEALLSMVAGHFHFTKEWLLFVYEMKVGAFPQGLF